MRKRAKIASMKSFRRDRRRAGIGVQVWMLFGLNKASHCGQQSVAREREIVEGERAPLTRPMRETRDLRHMHEGGQARAVLGVRGFGRAPAQIIAQIAPCIARQRGRHAGWVYGGKQPLRRRGHGQSGWAVWLYRMSYKCNA